MEIRLARDLQQDSIVDGEGLRTVIWTQGCCHNCKGCHNPNTHDFNGGYSVSVEEIEEKLLYIDEQDGITLSGGDPFFQAEACADIANFAKMCGLNVWCYTGFTFEKLLFMSKNDNNIKHLLEAIDVLVDGKFILEKKSFDLSYRGSSNQRVIDVKESLKNEKVILFKGYNEIKTSRNLYEKKSYVYA
ncbi:MAG: anaerobic ribonucleoside-triphosphate reductase activating protein [bacterium]|nr:anaerobic ribonucleoside-triphosphate reductase activating protein [bacterium]